MNNEIKYLIEIYKKKRASSVEKTGVRIGKIAERLNFQDKTSFDKNRQRAELLKRNSVFLEELRGIKKRLSENFFELFEYEQMELYPSDPWLALENPNLFL